jgi:hypothetical protein
MSGQHGRSNSPITSHAPHYLRQVPVAKWLGGSSEKDADGMAIERLAYVTVKAPNIVDSCAAQ